MNNSTINIIDSEYEELVRLRRFFHSNPECGPEEQIDTLGFISN